MPYIVDASADEPIILINTHLGNDPEDGQGVNGEEWAKELMYLDSLGKKVINVWINSPGGSVVDGWSMYNAMMQVNAKVDTHCIGIAASMSAVLFQAGRKRTMMDYSILMYHNPFGEDASNTMINVFKNSLVTMVASRSGKDKQFVSDMMDRTTYLTADEAHSYGMCDAVQASDEFNKKRAAPITNTAQAKQYYKTSIPVLNSLITKPTTMSFIKVTNKLKLTDNANEDSVVAAIQSIEDRATEAEKALGLEKLKTGEITNSLTTVTAERDKAVKELGEMKLKADTEAAAAKGIQAKELIANAIKMGKIDGKKPENVKTWEDKAVADFDSIKNLLDTIPATIKAPSIVTEARAVAEDGVAGSITNSIAQDMAALQAKFIK